MRPRKITPERERRYIAAVKLGATLKAASAAAGVDEVTMQRYRRRNAAFDAQVKEAEQNREVGWLRQIQKAAASGTWTAAAWLLERTNRAAYSRITKIEGGDPDKPVPVKLSADEDFAELVRKLAAMDTDALRDMARK